MILLLLCGVTLNTYSGALLLDEMRYFERGLALSCSRIEILKARNTRIFIHSEELQEPERANSVAPVLIVMGVQIRGSF